VGRREKLVEEGGATLRIGGRKVPFSKDFTKKERITGELGKGRDKRYLSSVVCGFD